MPAAKTTPDEARIREIAHSLWEKAGQPEGDPDRYWYEAVPLAEAEKKPKKRKPAAKKKTTKKPAA